MMRENDDPREDREEEPENSEDNMNWLDQLASGAGSIWDEPESTGDPLEDDLDLEATGDEIPDWLKADLEKDVPVDEDVPEWLVSEIAVNGTPENGDDVADPIEDPIDSEAEYFENLTDDERTVLYDSEELTIEKADPELEEEPPAEKELNWLEKIAAGEGASIEEPLTMDWDDVSPVESVSSEDQKGDSLTWIGDLETMPELELDADPDQLDEMIPAESAMPEDHLDSIIDEQIVDGREDLYDEVPDDPDEAMAWLEKLAAKQGAPLEELPSMNDEPVVIEADQYPAAEMAFESEDASSLDSLATDSMVSEVEVEFAAGTVEESEFPDIEDTLIYGMAGFTAEDVISQARGEVKLDSELVEGDIPEDPDEAMIWIEELSARQSAPDGLIHGTDDQVISAEAEEQLEGAHSILSEDIVSDLDEYGLSGELDEALSWLEEMVDLEEGNQDVPVEIIAEQPTPHVVHDVPIDFEEDAVIEVELMDQESEVAEEAFAFVEVEATDDTAEAFAWLDHLAETGSELPEDLDGPEVGEMVLLESDSLNSSDLADVNVTEDDHEVKEIPTLESKDPVFEALKDPLPSKPTVDEIDKEMAWLDTLGTVRAEEWISAEEEIPIQTQETIVDAPGEVGKAIIGREESVFSSEAVEGEIRDEKTIGLSPEEILGENEQAQLEIARSNLDAGLVNNALEQYESLLQDESSLPFVISDLEAFLDRDGNQLLAKRTLGDAYVRNGQLKKALEVYRQALDTL